MSEHLPQIPCSDWNSLQEPSSHGVMKAYLYLYQMLLTVLVIFALQVAMRRPLKPSRDNHRAVTQDAI